MSHLQTHTFSPSLLHKHTHTLSLTISLSLYKLIQHISLSRTHIPSKHSTFFFPCLIFKRSFVTPYFSLLNKSAFTPLLTFSKAFFIKCHFFWQWQFSRALIYHLIIVSFSCACACVCTHLPRALKVSEILKEEFFFLHLLPPPLTLFGSFRFRFSCRRQFWNGAESAISHFRFFLKVI